MNNTGPGQPILEDIKVSLLEKPTAREIEFLIFEIARRFPMTEDEIIGRAETIAKYFHERGQMLSAEVDKFKNDLVARGKFKSTHYRPEPTSVITRMFDKEDW